MLGNAERILASGTEPVPVAQALRTVKTILGQETNEDDREVYAMVIYGPTSRLPDHLSVINAVITATKRGWAEVSKLVSISKSAKGSQQSAIEVVEQNGIRIYHGWASPEELDQTKFSEEGVYIFPTHWSESTILDLGLKPLPKRYHALPLVFQVENFTVSHAGASSSKTRGRIAPHIERDSLEWRKKFVIDYPCLDANEVAEQSGNKAKNRSALSSRWISERKVFSIRYENKTLFPRFQFKDGSPNSVVAAILKQIPERYTGWDIAFFFTNSNSYLSGGKPVDLLSTDPDRVVSLAKAFSHPADVF